MDYFISEADLFELLNILEIVELQLGYQEHLEWVVVLFFADLMDNSILMQRTSEFECIFVILGIKYDAHITYMVLIPRTPYYVNLI